MYVHKCVSTCMHTDTYTNVVNCVALMQNSSISHVNKKPDQQRVQFPPLGQSKVSINSLLVYTELSCLVLRLGLMATLVFNFIMSLFYLYSILCFYLSQCSFLNAVFFFKFFFFFFVFGSYLLTNTAQWVNRFLD